MITKKVSEVAEEFLTSKRVEGVGFFYLEDRKYRMNKFAAAFPGRIDQIGTHEIEVWLNGLKVSGRTRNNYRNAVLQLFRYARGKRYLPRNEPTPVEDVAAANTEEGAIEISTPHELRSLLTHAPAQLLPFFAIGTLAGLRSQEMMRLDLIFLRKRGQGFGVLLVSWLGCFCCGGTSEPRSREGSAARGSCVCGGSCRRSRWSQRP